MTTFVDRHRSDFDYNADSGVQGSFGDILWRDQAGNDVLWLMNVNSPSSIATLPFVPPDWHVKAAAEFDAPGPGSGKSDILWQNDNGALALWQMNGTTVAAIHALPNPGPAWHVVGDNDFIADASDDVLFQHDTGALAIWAGLHATTGTVDTMLAGTQNPGPTWHVVGTGDTNQDFTAGILWQNDNGALVLWENPTFDFAARTFTFNTVATLPTVDPSWHVKGMADVSGDGRADIVFQNNNGVVAIWEMDGTSVARVSTVNTGFGDPGPTWHVVGLRDMNQDKSADILWQNDNGAAAVWEGFTSFGGGVASFLSVVITPNPNPNGHVWDLL